MAKKDPVFDVEAIQADIASLLKFSTFEPEYRYWLNTGSPEMNSVLGSEELGLPYGKLFEIAGEEHGGKTTITTVLASLAQNDGAVVGYIDVEDSRDPVWAEKLGLEWKKVFPVYSKLIKPKAGKNDSDVAKAIPRLQGAEELFAEAEVAMAKFNKMGFEKQFWFVDSVANLQTVMQGEAGTDGQNMRTKADKPMFLSNTLPKWCGLAANYNASVFFLNQLREKVGMVFGDPLTTSGGRSLKHNCHVRARVKRFKNGRILNKKEVIGIRSKITNVKNKAGSGSVEGRSCGFEIRWNTSPATVTFIPESELEAD